MNDLVNNILGWAADRNILEGSTGQAQMLKLVEEIGEFTSSMVRVACMTETDDPQEEYDEIQDGLGDAFVVLTILHSITRGSVIDTRELDTDERIAWSPLSLMACVGSIASCIARGRQPHKHDFTVALLCLDDIAQATGSTLERCAAMAYEEIKDRKGTMVNSVFVKEDE